MIPLLIGAAVGVVGVALLSDDDKESDGQWREETKAKKIIPESKLPPEIKRKLEMKRRHR